MNQLQEQVKWLSEFLDLELEIQSVKFIEDPAQVPETAICAREQLGHLALCQAFALVKREGKTVYTSKLAEWCWAPLIAMGYVDCEPGSRGFEEISSVIGIQDPDEARKFFAEFPKLPKGKYSGLLISPARSAEFDPDVLLVNCNNNYQMRTLFGAIKYKTGKKFEVSLDCIDSCIYTLFQSMLTREFTFAFPDPGEQERALSSRNESILGVPAERLGELIEGCRFYESIRCGYRDMQRQMEYDFERPSFYNRLYEIWGLEQGRVWERE